MNVVGFVEVVKVRNFEIINFCFVISDDFLGCVYFCEVFIEFYGLFCYVVYLLVFFIGVVGLF